MGVIFSFYFLNFLEYFISKKKQRVRRCERPLAPSDPCPASLILGHCPLSPTCFAVFLWVPAAPRQRRSCPASSRQGGNAVFLRWSRRLLFKQAKRHSPSGAPPEEGVQGPPAASPWEISDTLIFGRLQVLLPERGLEGWCRFSWTLSSSFSASSVCSDEIGTETWSCGEVLHDPEKPDRH